MVCSSGKIWLIGGTSESVSIAKMLLAAVIPLVVTVATPTALSLYPDSCPVVIGYMDQSQMKFFCQSQNIKAVVDASHPYAEEVSRNAIALSSQLNISYLRYERINHQLSATTQIKSNLIELDSFATLLSGAYLHQQRVLLTVGCKVLPLFGPWQEKATLFARVLPKLKSLESALDAGFTSDRLIAIRPPVSIALETTLWQQWRISLVVTKASGTAGGEDIKRQVATDLNIPLIVITRPQITYPQQTSSFEEVLAFVKKLVGKID